jgi:DNA replication protein DnaC
MNSDVVAAQVKLFTQELKMPGLRVHFEEIAREARGTGESHEAYLVACLRAEIESRREHRLQDRLKQARFPHRKTLEEFDFALVPSVPKEEILSLAQGEFVRARENVILLGASGTGKTHLAQAIGHAAIYAGARVRFTSAVALAQELLAAQDEHRLPRYLKSWQKTDLARRTAALSVLRRTLRERICACDLQPGVLPLERGVRRSGADCGPS